MRFDSSDSDLFWTNGDEYDESQFSKDDDDQNNDELETRIKWRNMICKFLWDISMLTAISVNIQNSTHTDFHTGIHKYRKQADTNTHADRQKDPDKLTVMSIGLFLQQIPKHPKNPMAAARAPRLIMKMALAEIIPSRTKATGNFGNPSISPRMFKMYSGFTWATMPNASISRPTNCQNTYRATMCCKVTIASSNTVT